MKHCNHQLSKCFLHLDTCIIGALSESEGNHPQKIEKIFALISNNGRTTVPEIDNKYVKVVCWKPLGTALIHLQVKL